MMPFSDSIRACFVGDGPVPAQKMDGHGDPSLLSVLILSNCIMRLTEFPSWLSLLCCEVQN